MAYRLRRPLGEVLHTDGAAHRLDLAAVRLDAADFSAAVQRGA
ncbi:hypothetical protein [Dactylosporangium sp. CA-139066]